GTARHEPARPARLGLAKLRRLLRLRHGVDGAGVHSGLRAPAPADGCGRGNPDARRVRRNELRPDGRKRTNAGGVAVSATALVYNSECGVDRLDLVMNQGFSRRACTPWNRGVQVRRLNAFITRRY